jgi:hypothetical protein
LTFVKTTPAATVNLRLMIKRLAVLALCALMGLGLPLYAGYAAGGEGAPPVLMADDGEMPDCAASGDVGLDCGQYCAAMCAGMVLDRRCDALTPLPRDGVSALPAASFRSHAGPPGLQPPR